MSTPFSGPAYRIRTSRLILRCWNLEDAPLLKEAIDESREHLLPWMPWAKNEPQPIEAKVAYLRHWRSRFDRDEEFVYGVFDPEEERVLGGCGLHTRLSGHALEIGYWIHVNFINQGLATELSAALTKVAFEVHCVRRVEIHCDPRNVRSAAVPRKLGYVHEATLKKRVPAGETELLDSMIWTLFDTDYPSSPAASAEIEAFDALGQKIL
jgi:RimJ/RimL family protein N-acetyltransferase